jgi:hypothetical protein
MTRISPSCSWSFLSCALTLDWSYLIRWSVFADFWSSITNRWFSTTRFEFVFSTNTDWGGIPPTRLCRSICCTEVCRTPTTGWVAVVVVFVTWWLLTTVRPSVRASRLLIRSPTWVSNWFTSSQSIPTIKHDILSTAIYWANWPGSINWLLERTIRELVLKLECCMPGPTCDTAGTLDADSRLPLPDCRTLIWEI